MKKSWNHVIASSVVALSVMTGLEAGFQPREWNKKEEKKESFAFSFPKDLNLTNPVDIYFYVSGLAIQASEGGLAFGIRNDSGNASGAGGAALPITNGKVYNFDWSYNPGVRVGVGGYIDHDAWDLEVNYTWIHFTNYQSVSVPSGSTIIPLWATGADSPAGTFGNGASAAWNGNYHVIDGWMGKPYHVSRYFVMNPVFGVRFAIIDQNFRIDYSGTSSRTEMNAVNNFWGIGLRSALNMDWICAKEWKFFGTLGGALLRGHFATDQSVVMPSSSFNGSSFRDHFWDNSPVIDMTLGVEWGRHFNCDKSHVAVRAAYEFQEWFDQFQVRKIFSGGFAANNGMGNDGLRSNFSLNGFSLALQFDF